jgi:DNA-binding LacI/PurR family transcriptional regulator
VETKTLTAAQLRERMSAHDVTQSALAREAHIPQSDVSAILNGRDYCGRQRRERIEAAIMRLGLDREPDPEPIEVRDKAGNIVFRLRV